LMVDPLHLIAAMQFVPRIGFVWDSRGKLKIRSRPS
jgi:hypothetical protein